MITLSSSPKNYGDFTRHANAYRARELAVAEHVPPSTAAKSVVFCADKSYGIALMPADRELDLEELADHLGVSKIRLATESEVAKLGADSEVGAMPPFGALFNLPVYMDQHWERRNSSCSAPALIATRFTCG